MTLNPNTSVVHFFDAEENDDLLHACAARSALCHVISTMKLSWGEFLGSATMVMQDSFMLLAQLFFLSCHTNM